jgi:hypothetical protein
MTMAGWRHLMVYFRREDADIYEFLQESVGSGNISKWVVDAIKAKRNLRGETSEARLIRRIIREELDREKENHETDAS